MAASLDEIQGYDLLQIYLEEKLEEFVVGKDRVFSINASYTINALIEYACFNCYLEKIEHLDAKFVLKFGDWFKMFSGIEMNEALINTYLNFIQNN